MRSSSPYRPPRHMQPYPMNTSIASSEWEWNNLAARSGVELWAIRVPRDLKVSKLAALQFADNVNSKGSKKNGGGAGEPIATFTTSKQKYTLHDASSSSFSAGHNGAARDTIQNPSLVPTLTDDKLLEVDPSAVGKGKRSRTGEASNAETRNTIQDELGDVNSGGGEEMHALKLMVPDAKRQGRYYVAPKPIARCLVLKASYEVAAKEEEVEETTVENDATTTTATTSSAQATVVRRPQPLDKLKYRNIPFGAANEQVLSKLGEDVKARLINGTTAAQKVDEVEDVVMAGNDDDDAHKKKKKRKSESSSKPKKVKA